MEYLGNTRAGFFLFRPHFDTRYLFLLRIKKHTRNKLSTSVPRIKLPGTLMKAMPRKKRDPSSPPPPSCRRFSSKGIRERFSFVSFMKHRYSRRSRRNSTRRLNYVSHIMPRFPLVSASSPSDPRVNDARRRYCARQQPQRRKSTVSCLSSVVSPLFLASPLVANPVFDRSRFSLYRGSPLISFGPGAALISRPGHAAGRASGETSHSGASR